MAIHRFPRPAHYLYRMKYNLLVFLLILQMAIRPQVVSSQTVTKSETQENSSGHPLGHTFPANQSSPNTSLRLISERHSLTGQHLSYIQLYLDIPLHNARLDVHLDQQGQVIHIQDQLVDMDESEVLIPASIDDADENLNWFKSGDRWVLATWKITDSVMGVSSLIHENTLLAQRQNKLFKQLPDSLVKAQVFLINPLNTARKPYGSPYIDSNDLDVPVINAQRRWVEMKAYYENDTFWLKNNRYFIGEISDPVVPPTFSVTDTFSFLRSASQFEDVNAFYHINQYSNQVQELGYVQLLPKKLIIDAHAYNGADLSSFNFNVTPLQLEFGEGGVDDAEDGEVVVHEFGHALSYMASPKTVDGMERRSMEEGICDYFSTTYALQFSDYAWKQIFNWDGHNPFWNGIRTGVIKYYPEDLQQSTNADRELWSTPLLCLYDKLGQARADTLILEHLFFQTSNTTMPQMAVIMLKIDSILWQGANYYDIKECFVRHKILRWNTELSTEDLHKSGIKVLNTSGFSAGTGPVEVVSPGKGIVQVEIHDMMGRRIAQKSGQGSVLIPPQGLPAGVYVLNILQNDVTLSVKIAKND